MPAGYTWLTTVLLVAAVPIVAFLWWAVAFLPWMRARLPLRTTAWPPTLPTVFTDLDIAVFGPLGASLVVLVLLRRVPLAFLSILIGFGVSAVLTLGRGADIQGRVINSSERYVMLAICAVSAFVGLALAASAIRSSRAFGFLGLLAVVPVASLVALVVLNPGADARWLIRSALVGLLLLVAKDRWIDVRLWPIFFVLFWLLNLLSSALAFGAQTLSRPGSAQSTVGTVADAMVSFVRSAWATVLGNSWQTLWPAVVIAALLLACKHTWSRLRQATAEPSGGGRRPAPRAG
jgi:hypothetical protein